MTTPAQRFRVDPGSRIGGVISVPGDKSISHRALMLGAIAQGHTTVRGFLEGEDCLATRSALTALGVVIDDEAGGTLRIEGRGSRGLRAAAHPLDLGNSGTAIRLMMGLLAGQDFASVLTGDASLRKRPMARVAEPLAAMGARIETTAGTAPVHIHGGARLRAVDCELPVASAQIKSALLIAALGAQGRTTIRSPGPSRDHTERMLMTMGIGVDVDRELHAVSIEGPVELRGCAIDVPGDLSSAAFFIVAACLAAESGLLIENVGVNPTRTGVLTILEEMGAKIERRNPRNLGAEPVADLFVEKSDLRGVVVPPAMVPLAIDEFPVLFVAAAGAAGRTVVAGADELRHKESDRIAVMARALEAVGARVQEQPDGLIIDGGPLRGGRIDSEGDHRVAMASAIASLIGSAPIEILNTEQVATSFPNFVDTAAAAGLRIDGYGARRE
jgi:3-phosphoshikimate 1-carboxyvinyltransferase